MEAFCANRDAPRSLAKDGNRDSHALVPVGNRSAGQGASTGAPRETQGTHFYDPKRAANSPANLNWSYIAFLDKKSDADTDAHMLDMISTHPVYTRPPSLKQADHKLVPRSSTSACS